MPTNLSAAQNRYAEAALSRMSEPRLRDTLRHMGVWFRSDASRLELEQLWRASKGFPEAHGN